MIGERIRELFAGRAFIAGEELTTALELTLALEKPLLIEGPAGVGKTETAKVLADAFWTKLIRLQCYEGLDASSALYEWNYSKQLLRIRLTENDGASTEAREAQIFSEPFLLRRPLLEAITQERAPVLLIDEIDRADEAFEAFLLELLGEFQMTIPELSTITARSRPAVILTSNRTREISDALRRRCLYLWLDYPSRDQEVAILRARLPEIDARSAAAQSPRSRRKPGLGTRADSTAPRCARCQNSRSDSRLHFESSGRLGSAARASRAVFVVAKQRCSRAGSDKPGSRLRSGIRPGTPRLEGAFRATSWAHIVADGRFVMDDLTTNVAVFCAMLRDELHFVVGQAEPHGRIACDRNPRRHG